MQTGEEKRIDLQTPTVNLERDVRSRGEEGRRRKEGREG